MGLRSVNSLFDPKPRFRWPLDEIFVGGALFLSASLSLLLTRVPGGIALFWSGSAIAAALLLRLPQVRWASAVGILALAMWLANIIAAHRPLPVAAWFAMINMAEIALMVGAFRWVWKLPLPYITVLHAALMTIVLGIAIPGLTALAGGTFLHVQFGVPWLESASQWWSSHSIGACLLAPPIVLFSVKGWQRLTRRRFLAENILTWLVCVIGCYVAFRYVRFPFVVVGLLLLVAAFRLGGFGASLLSLSIGLLMSGLWIFGIRPLGLDVAVTPSGTLIGMPVIALLATVMPPIAVGLGSDARRAAARGLRGSERRFRDSMEHSPIGMLIADLDGAWTYSNVALQKMLGYSGEELRNLPPGGPSKREDWQDSQSRWSQLLAGKVDFYDVARSFRHKDGRWIWTHVAVSLLRDEDGSPINFIAQIESLEARKQAEQVLAAERDRLKVTLESISDAVITTDSSTRITYINPAAEALLGLTLQAVEQRRVDEVIHLMDPDSGKVAANLIGQCVLHGIVFRREQACLLHRPDGSISYVTDVVSPVMEANSLLSGLVIVLRDAGEDISRRRDLQHRAFHDPLTGLSNRADFGERLRGAFVKARHFGRSAAVIAIDLDRFKAVNDAAGHAAGDAVLCKVAEACRAAVRSSDTVARLGGDEFAIILESCTEARAHRIGQQLVAALNPLGIVWRGTRYEVNASLGLAMNSSGMHDATSWIESADKACYVAKQEGRGQLRIANGAASRESSVELKAPRPAA